VIDRRELLASAGNLGLLPNVVEKDYVLGWLLAGIYNHPALKDSWVFTVFNVDQIEGLPNTITPSLKSR
jgi:hypothetical protein